MGGYLIHPARLVQEAADRLGEPEDPYNFGRLAGLATRGARSDAPRFGSHDDLWAHRRLNLGDCFACALSEVEDCGIITLDADFKSVGRPVVMPGGRG